MAYQLDHRSQGASAHASVPAWSTSASAVWSIEFEIEVFALSSTITLGGATYAARVAQITTAGTVTCQNSSGGTVLTSAAGAVTVGINTIKVERKSDGLWQLTVNGVSVSTSSTAACAPMTYIASRVQNSYTNTNIAIRRIVTSGGAYSTVWDGTNAPSTGTTWTSSGGQVATLNNFTGVTDSWWVFYNSITANIPNNTLGAALNQACAINLNNYFTGATSCSVLSGSLPTGLSLVGNQLVGTPTTAQSTTLVIRASNSIDTLDSATITFNTGLWAIQQSGSTGYLQAPAALSFTASDDWVFRFALDQASNAFFRVIGNPSAFDNRIFVNPAGLILRVEFNTGADNATFALPSGFTIATRRDFVITKSGSSYTLTIDGGAPITATLVGTGRGWTAGAATAFFRSGGTTMADGRLYYFEFEKNGVIQNSYDPNTSGGVGNLLIDRVNKNNASQAGTWPAGDAEWVSYAPVGGGEFTVSVNSTYPQYTVTSNADNVKPVKTASISSIYGNYTASVSATAVLNDRSATVNGTYVKYGAAVTGTNVKPIKTTNVVTTYPSYTASVSLTGDVNTYTLNVNAIYPQYTVSVSIADVNKLSISTSYPAYTSTIISTNTKPVKTVSVVSSYPVYSVGSILTNVDPVSSLTINSTYPKYTASVSASTPIEDKTLSISSSYPVYIGVVVIGNYVSAQRIGGKGAHVVVELGSRNVVVKDKSRNVKWRVENARL